MTATIEAPTTNPHQPNPGPDTFIHCAAPDCEYAQFTHRLPGRNEDQTAAFWTELFRSNHTAQHDPGRAPDITVEWEISASCSVCEDTIGDIVVNDSDSIRCKDCGTTWSIDGSNGERDEDLNAEEVSA